MTGHDADRSAGQGVTMRIVVLVLLMVVDVTLVSSSAQETRDWVGKKVVLEYLRGMNAQSDSAIATARQPSFPLGRRSGVNHFPAARR